MLQLSSRVPVVVEFYAPGLEPAMGSVVESYGGRLVLATVDAQANPQLAQAFRCGQIHATHARLRGKGHKFGRKLRSAAFGNAMALPGQDHNAPALGGFISN